MDPVSQTLAQQTSGSAEGQGFGQFYIQGAQLGRERQRINLAQQRLNIEKAQEARQADQYNLMRPYLAENYKNQNIILGTQAASNTLEQKIKAAQATASPAMLQLQDAFMTAPQGWNDPELRMQYEDILTHDPFARFTPEGQRIEKGLQGNIVNKQFFNQLDQAEARVKGTDTFVKGFNQYGPEFGTIRADDTPAIRNFMFEQKLRGKVEAYPEGSFEHTLYKQMLTDFQAHASSTTTDLLEKRISAYERVVGPLSPERKKRIADIVTGLEPRTGAETPLDVNKYIAQHLDQVMSTPTIPNEDRPGKLRTPKSREEGINWLRSEFNFITKGTPLPQGKAAPGKETGLLDRLMNKPTPAAKPSTTLAPDEVWMISPPDATGRRVKGKAPKDKVDELKQQGYEPYEG